MRRRAIRDATGPQIVGVHRKDDRRIAKQRQHVKLREALMEKTS